MCNILWKNFSIYRSYGASLFCRSSFSLQPQSYKLSIFRWLFTNLREIFYPDWLRLSPSLFLRWVFQPFLMIYNIHFGFFKHWRDFFLFISLFLYVNWDIICYYSYTLCWILQAVLEFVVKSLYIFIYRFDQLAACNWIASDMNHKACLIHYFLRFLYGISHPISQVL